MKPIPENARVALIGVVFRHGNEEQPWLVQDNRKALTNELPCSAKADVLDKIAEILDDMHLPPNKLDQDSDPAEVTVAVGFDPADARDTRDFAWDSNRNRWEVGISESAIGENGVLSAKRGGIADPLAKERTPSCRMLPDCC